MTDVKAPTVVSKIKRGSIAFVLSILVPGLGHVYIGQLLAGILIPVSFIVLILIAALLGLVHAFSTALIYLTVLLFLQLSVAFHALAVAVRQVKNNTVPARTYRSYISALVPIGATVILGLSFPGGASLGVRGYKVPAESMSPTLIQGDRFIADTEYYRTHVPKRGDVIVFREPTQGEILVKRVIALAGDTIRGNVAGTVVNGQLILEPYITPSHTDSEPEFGPVKIPPNELFVMGDNRSASYDSRYFGPVGLNKVIGKALYIYYSANQKGRVGHPVQ